MTRRSLCDRSIHFEIEVEGRDEDSLFCLLELCRFQIFDIDDERSDLHHFHRNLLGRPETTLACARVPQFLV